MTQISVNPKITALILAFASITSIFAMLHHPEIHAQDLREQVTELSQKAGMSGLVHGALITLLLFYCQGFMQYSQIRGLHRTGVSFALLCFLLGSIGMIGAALISGFILPNIVGSYLSASDVELLDFNLAKRLSWQANQALANSGAVAWLLAIIAWSWDGLYCKAEDKLSVWIFRGFMLLGLVSLLAFGLGIFMLDVAGMTYISLLLAGFGLALAWMLFKRK